MSFTPPSSGSSHGEPGPSNAPRPPYAVQPPPFPGAPGPVVPAQAAQSAQTALAPAGPPRARPSWVAWVALGLSALSFLVATSVGIIYAAQTLSSDEVEDGLYYDAGLPAWGSVELSPTGQATERALTDSVEEALRTGIQDFDGRPEDIGDVYCEALAAPRKDSVGTCGATVQDVDSTVVLFFTDDEGGFLATIF